MGYASPFPQNTVSIPHEILMILGTRTVNCLVYPPHPPLHSTSTTTSPASTQAGCSPTTRFEPATPGPVFQAAEWLLSHGDDSTSPFMRSNHRVTPVTPPSPTLLACGYHPSESWGAVFCLRFSLDINPLSHNPISKMSRGRNLFSLGGSGVVSQGGLVLYSPF